MNLQKMSSVEDASATVEARLQALEKNMGSRFEAIDARLGAVEALLKNLVAQLTGASREG
jgi:molybdopterin converting factor small subunit